MIFTINNVDILPYVAFQGLKMSISDIDGPNAGRTMDGTMIRDRVAQKYRWDVTCRPLTGDELAIMLDLLEGEFLRVRFTDPRSQEVVAKTMYTNNVPSQYLLQRGGMDYWGGLTFPLIER